MSDDYRERVLDKLLKLQSRFKGKSIWPPKDCGDVDTHIAGVFLREHLGILIEAIRRMD